MKRIVTITAALLFLILNFRTEAQETQYKAQSFDTLFHTQIGEGAFYTEYENQSVPLKIQMVKFNLNQSGLEIRTVAANNLLAGGYEKTSDMKSKLEDENTFVVAGVNGDFYAAGGVPTNVQIVDGEMLRAPISRDIIAFDSTFKPWIAKNTSFSGQVTGNGISVNINNINASRGANQLIAYNTFSGNKTGANAYGTEIGLKVLSEVSVNRPAQYVVTRIEKNKGDMSFNGDNLILSAHGTAANNFDGLAVDDTLSVQLNLNPFTNAILEAVGGNGQFLKNGEVIETWAEWHPRTAIGFSQDTTTGYFMVVDGRQSASRGMTTGQMGIFMKSLGASDAINLDGGGSSTMLVQDEVVNNPSDGIERSVANAVFVTLPYSGTGEVERVKLRTNNPKVFMNKSTTLKALGFDSNHKFKQLPISEVDFNVGESLGIVSSNGVFNASMEAGSGYIYLSYGSFEDSTKITILGVGEIKLSPKNVSLDMTMEFSPSYLVYDELGHEQSVPRNEINWSVTNSELGTIDSAGKYKATGVGNNGVIATYGNISDTTWAVVYNTEGYHIVNDFSKLDDWAITTEHLPVDSVKLTQLENEVIEVSFRYPPNNKEPHIFLNHKSKIEGVPKFANIVSASDGGNYVVTLDIETETRDRFRMNPTRYASFTEPEVMHYTFKKGEVSGLNSTNFYFPFNFESVNIRLPKNTTNGNIEGYIRLYEVGVSYGDTPVSNEKESQLVLPQNVNLNQNYPNPFNPTTNISFSLPKSSNVELKVFDLLGREVQVLVNERLSSGGYHYTFDASALSSGVYFYQLKTDAGLLSKKMTLIK
ncbi:MAG: phosphodiester glycosidase family protein [Balneolaceae bacterium]